MAENPFKETEMALNRGLNELIPGYMHDGVRNHILHGRAVGGFLSALFNNDLMGAFERADMTNQMCMRKYAEFLYNYAPAGCYGSIEKTNEWRKRGGLKGIAADE